MAINTSEATTEEGDKHLNHNHVSELAKKIEDMGDKLREI
jgi:hypothetical protein